MSRLPDLEALAIFAKVAERHAFAGAAEELGLSKATVSKAVARLEAKLGTRLLNRTSRRLALTDAGRSLVPRAAAMLAEAEAAESEIQHQSAAPRGRLRVAAPMSFGNLYIAPLLPDFLRRYPEISVDLHLSDERIDLVGEGFDGAIRIAALPDSSLVARKLCDMPMYLLAAPSLIKDRGRPKHPLELAEQPCITYAYQSDSQVWRFRKASGDAATVRPAGPLRANNGDAMLPSLIAGLGFGLLPEFLARTALAEGRLEIILPEWQLPAGAVHWLTPPGGPKPLRLKVIAEFLAERLSPGKTARCSTGASRR